MAFTLKVTRGAGAGAEFPFDTTEARLGRTADNDIVVKDSGASRSHARVFQKGTRFFIEDMKSANGTKLNGGLITGTKELKSGDTVTIGEVTFTFSAADETLLKPPSIEVNQTLLKAMPLEELEPSGDHTAENPALDPNATLLKPPHSPGARASLAAADPERERRTGRSERVSRSLKLDDETVPPSRGTPGKLVKDETETVPPTRGLARRDAAPKALEPADGGTAEVKVPPALVRRGGGKSSDDDDEHELTAADKLRLRRQANKSALGRITYGWSQLPMPARLGTAALGALLVLGFLGFVVYSMLPQKKKPVGPEPMEITGGAPTIEASFGLGDGVTFERADMKIFQFNAASATRIVGVLHYQARDISKDEVAVSINGFDLGFVPPDTLDTQNRELELVLPALQVKKGENNQIVFDNTRNPPGEETWRIWNLWLELIAIPDMSQEETINAVKEDIERSEKFYEQRDIGPENLFKAWKGYRDAWLRMESMASRPEELYIVARSQQREMAQLLERRCNLMLLEFQKAMSAKKPDRRKGREVVEDMLRYFPTREHRCHGLARDLMEDLGGL